MNKNPSRGELRKFGWAMLLGFALVGVGIWLLAWWRTDPMAGLFVWSGVRQQIASVVAWFLGVVLWALGVLAPLPMSRPIYVVWMTVATRIGIVMSTILLSVMFFVLLPPFSLLIRLGDPLRKKLTRGGTYWEDCKPHEPTLERVARPF